MRTEAAVDYITITTGLRSTQAEEREVKRLAFDLLERDGMARRSKEFRWNGYQGVCTPHVQLGVRQDGTILRVSGGMAEAAGCSLPAGGQNITRVDLAFTAWVDDPTFAPRGAIEQNARSAALERSRSKPCKVTLIDSGNSGQTLLVGSRTSAQYGRLYDKAAESGDSYYKGAWRWEVEYKTPLAKQVASTLPVDKARSPAIAALVGSWFTSRGVVCPVTPAGDSCAPRAPRRACRTDHQRREWLRTQVRGTVQDLICVFGEWDIYSLLFLPEGARKSTDSL